MKRVSLRVSVNRQYSVYGSIFCLLSARNKLYYPVNRECIINKPIAVRGGAGRGNRSLVFTEYALESVSRYNPL